MTEDLKILHTSDVHLGAPFLFLGSKGEDQRRALRDALERTVKIAHERSCRAIVIAGDLFDDAFDAREGDVSFAALCLAGAGPSCRVVILPGGHDRYTPGSVLERERARFEASGTVHILTPDRSVVVFPDISLAVHGTALVSSSPARGALASLAPVRECRYNVCLAHGSVASAGARLDESEEPLRLEDLPSGFDYVALGHWHSRRVVRPGDPAAYYSGSPEIIARDQRGAGSVYLVEFSRAGARVESVEVGKRRIERVEVDCTGIGTTEDLVRAVVSAAKPDADLIVELALSGYFAFEAAVDVETAAEALAGRYFSLRLVGEKPSRAIGKEVLLAAPEDTVAGRFARILLDRIEGAVGEERALLEEALQMGIQLLKGRDPT